MDLIEIRSVDLTSLKDVCKLIKIELDNSVDIIDKLGGPDTFFLVIDTARNAAIPYNHDKNLPLIEQFTNANYAEIYEWYVELESFEGTFSISAADNIQKWCFDFVGDSLLDESTELDELTGSNLKKITEIINPQSMFQLAYEILENLK